MIVKMLYSWIINKENHYCKSKPSLISIDVSVTVKTIFYEDYLFSQSVG